MLDLDLFMSAALSAHAPSDGAVITHQAQRQLGPILYTWSRWSDGTVTCEGEEAGEPLDLDAGAMAGWLRREGKPRFVHRQKFVPFQAPRPPADLAWIETLRDPIDRPLCHHVEGAPPLPPRMECQCGAPATHWGIWDYRHSPVLFACDAHLVRTAGELLHDPLSHTYAGISDVSDSRIAWFPVANTDGLRGALGRFLACREQARPIVITIQFRPLV